MTDDENEVEVAVFGLPWWMQEGLERPRMEVIGTHARAMECAIQRAVETGRRQSVTIVPMFHKGDGSHAKPVYLVKERDVA